MLDGRPPTLKGDTVSTPTGGLMKIQDIQKAIAGKQEKRMFVFFRQTEKKNDQEGG